MCRTHNRLLAEHDYGAEQIAQHIADRRRLRPVDSDPKALSRARICFFGEACQEGAGEETRLS